ncbi:MAG: hypothetical protein AAGH15_09770 [Myxococcota bacterium]
MATGKETLARAMKLDGALATALVDYTSNRVLGTAGGGAAFDIDAAARGNVAVLRAKRNLMRQLGIEGGVDDILITLDAQYHLIRPLHKHPHLFLYLAIRRDLGNLARARQKLKELGEALDP